MRRRQLWNPLGNHGMTPVGKDLGGRWNIWGILAPCGEILSRRGITAWVWERTPRPRSAIKLPKFPNSAPIPKVCALKQRGADPPNQETRSQKFNPKTCGKGSRDPRKGLEKLGSGQGWGSVTSWHLPNPAQRSPIRPFVQTNIPGERQIPGNTQRGHGAQGPRGSGLRNLGFSGGSCTARPRLRELSALPELFLLPDIPARWELLPSPGVPRARRCLRSGMEPIQPGLTLSVPAFPRK